VGDRDEIQRTEAETGNRKLFRQACRQRKAGFLRDDDGGEYGGQLRAGGKPERKEETGGEREPL